MRRFLKRHAVHQPPQHHCGENIARADEAHRNEVERDAEKLAFRAVISDDAVLAVHLRARHDDGFRAHFVQANRQRARFFLGHVLVIGHIRQIRRLGVVWHDAVRHGDHLAHMGDGFLPYAVVQLALVAHDGVNKDQRAFLRGLLTEIGHQRRLFR